MQEQERIKVVGIITALADVLGETLSELTIEAYLEDLDGYDFDIINRAATLCRRELRYMPRPFDILTRISRLEEEDFAKRSKDEQLERIPEPEPTDADKAFGTFVCEAMSGWTDSDFVKRQREAGTFVNYDQSLFAYIGEQNMEQKHIDRLAATYLVDPREVKV